MLTLAIPFIKTYIVGHITYKIGQQVVNLLKGRMIQQKRTTRGRHIKQNGAVHEPPQQILFLKFP
ncbi:MAG: hypothetical protein C0410_08160 [Anaerolinea sp.]|nr:hypothetical protein [Anaerolinea sp.]